MHPGHLSTALRLYKCPSKCDQNKWILPSCALCSLTVLESISLICSVFNNFASIAYSSPKLFLRIPAAHSHQGGGQVMWFTSFCPPPPALSIPNLASQNTKNHRFRVLSLIQRTSQKACEQNPKSVYYGGLFRRGDDSITYFNVWFWILSGYFLVIEISQYWMGNFWRIKQLCTSYKRWYFSISNFSFQTFLRIFYFIFFPPESKDGFCQVVFFWRFVGTCFQTFFVAINQKSFVNSIAVVLSCSCGWSGVWWLLFCSFESGWFTSPPIRIIFDTFPNIYPRFAFYYGWH